MKYRGGRGANAETCAMLRLSAFVMIFPSLHSQFHIPPVSSDRSSLHYDPPLLVQQRVDAGYVECINRSVCAAKDWRLFSNFKEVKKL